MYPPPLSMETLALCNHLPVPGTPQIPACCLELLMDASYPPVPTDVYPPVKPAQHCTTP